MEILDILKNAMEKEASDIFLVAGLPVTYKVRGHQSRDGDRLLPDAIDQVVAQIYQLSKRDRKLVDQGLDDDFSFAVSNMGRFRVNVFRQRGSLAAVIRVIRFGLPDPVQLGIPETVLALAEEKISVLFSISISPKIHQHF